METERSNQYIKAHDLKHVSTFSEFLQESQKVNKKKPALENESAEIAGEEMVSQEKQDLAK